MFDEYEMVYEDGTTFAYLRAAEGASVQLVYEPLADTPHLFLDFARLAEHKDMLVALSDWVARYGLLGLHRSNGRGRKAENLGSTQDFRHDPWPLLEEPEDYSDRGGEGETEVLIEREMLLANRLLLYWEAILSKEESHLERAIFENQFLPKQAKDLRETYRRDYKRTGATYVDMLVQDATFFVMACVQEVLEAFTYPCLALAPASRKPEALAASWRPRNLLGAMYLQFYWLITSESELSRCRYCGRIIPYFRPSVGTSRQKRKPRKDKEFCDSRCRQTYHYHNRVKQGSKSNGA